MSDLLPYITAAGAIVAAIVAVIGALNAYHARQAAEEAKAGMIEVNGKIYRLDERVDGRLSQLLEVNAQKAVIAADLARSEGHAAGEQSQRDRAAESAP